MEKTTRKKIIYVITKSNFGGAQRYVYDLAHVLRDDYDVSVVLGGDGILRQKLTAIGIRTHSLSRLQRNVSIIHDLHTFWHLLRIFRNEKPDIIHLNSSKIGGIGAVAGRLAGIKKIIFTAHGWACNEKRNIIAQSCIHVLSWITILLSHTTIMVSQSMRAHIRFLIPDSKIVTIYNGISIIPFVERTEARKYLMAKNPKLRNDTVWIGTLSELHTNKGLDFAIDAMAQITKTHKNAQFVIMGTGEEQQRLTRQITQHNLHENVCLLGFVENGAQYVKAFDIFTLTSRTEAFSYAILEAGLAKLPIIASHVGGVPEIIEDGITGLLVAKGNVTEISMAIQTLLDSPTLRTELGENVYRKVIERFSLEILIQKTCELYETTT